MLSSTPGELERAAARLGFWYPPERRRAAATLERAGASAVPVLARVLRRGSGPARSAAVRLLSAHYLAEVEGLLIEALRDRAPTVRRTAMRALGLRRSTAALPALLGMVKSGPASCREAAIRALGRIGDPRAAPVLLEILARDSLRTTVVESLGMIGEPIAVPALVAILGEQGPSELQHVILALGRIRHPDSAAALVDYATRQRWTAPAIRQPLLRLGQCAVPALIDALDRDRTTVVFASELLQELDEEAVPGLLEALDRPAATEGGSWRRRAHAAQVLGAIRSPASTPALIRTLADPTVQVRFEAALALGELGDPAACPALRTLLPDEAPSVQAAAAVALILCEGYEEALIPLVVGGLDRSHPEFLRRRALRALLQFTRAAPTPALRAAIPRLRAALHPMGAAAGERDTVRRVLSEIEAATGNLAALPLPAAGLEAQADQLPRPAAAPDGAPHSLPRPAPAADHEPEFLVP
ncbi:MAG: HEAT repeat domain-containing protein [Armatimonadota bacterium]